MQIGAEVAYQGEKTTTDVCLVSVVPTVQLAGPCLGARKAVRESRAGRESGEPLWRVEEIVEEATRGRD